MEEAREAMEAALKALSIEEMERQLNEEMERQLNEHIQKTLERDAEPLVIESKPKTHYQYYEPAEGTGGLPAVVCTCGEKKHHLRFKVLERWSQKHFEKTGHNTQKQV